jgi:hypothetical protein
MSDSRSRFEAWALMRISSIEYDTSWQAWQAAETETARQCASITAGWVEGGNIANDIRANFPEAFK